MDNNDKEIRIKESLSSTMKTKIVSLNFISTCISTVLIKKIFSDFFKVRENSSFQVLFCAQEGCFG